MKYKNMLKSILAGFSISFAGVAYLCVDSSLIGSLLFSVGLLAIYLFDWNLYTGKCCFIPSNAKSYLPICLVAFIGNLIGTVLVGYALRLTNLDIINRAAQVLSPKLSHSYIETFVLAIFCGVMMSIAVLGYKTQKDDFGRYIIVVLPIVIFILAKFEHVVANMFYISLANYWNLETIVFIAICAVGNMLGCCIIPFIHKKTIP